MSELIWLKLAKFIQSRGGKPDTCVWELRGCYNQESWENCSLMNQFSDLGGGKEDDSCLRISHGVIMVGLQEAQFYVGEVRSLM